MASYAIKQYHGGYNIQPRSASAVRYIVVHYTGSGTPAAGAAKANCIYFSGGNRQASAHYFIDNASIYEYADPATHLCWHVGDGKGAYGITNTNSIGIEVCQDGDRPFTEEEQKRLTWLVGVLMERFGVPAERVVRHYDASRKLCPYHYSPSGSGGSDGWERLHARIVAQEGWVRGAKGWWYRNADGTWPASEWLKTGGEWFLFDDGGYLRSGWAKWKGSWYWLHDVHDGRFGAMDSSRWVKWKGSWYWLKADGRMAASETLELSDATYTFDASGKWVR